MEFQRYYFKRYGPNYKKLKTIEDELAKYEVTDDGAIVKKSSSYSIDLISY